MIKNAPELRMRTEVALQMASSYVASNRIEDAYNVLAAHVDSCRHDGVNTSTDPGGHNGRRQPLTKRQRELLDYVIAFNAEHGYSPTYEEMQKHFQCAVGSIVGLVKELRARGWVRTARLRARSIQVVEDAR